jgi:hypothetical protein
MVEKYVRKAQIRDPRRVIVILGEETEEYLG